MAAAGSPQAHSSHLGKRLEASGGSLPLPLAGGGGVPRWPCSRPQQTPDSVHLLLNTLLPPRPQQAVPQPLPPHPDPSGVTSATTSAGPHPASPPTCSCPGFPSAAASSLPACLPAPSYLTPSTPLPGPPWDSELFSKPASPRPCPLLSLSDPSPWDQPCDPFTPQGRAVRDHHIGGSTLRGTWILRPGQGPCTSSPGVSAPVC